MISSEVVDKALSYEQYFQLVKSLIAEGKTTGKNQSEEYFKHTKLNFQRMKRVYRKTVLSDQLRDKLQIIAGKQTWVVLSEAWCGDAAQNLPVLARIADENENIDLRILLRDENPELMEKYLTNGSKSIPKLIAIEEQTERELFTWGPRPAPFQNMVKKHKTDPRMSNKEFSLLLHKEYTKDNSKNLQEELKSLLEYSLN